MGKRYLCKRFPNLSIGGEDVKFSDGFYTAKDEAEEQLIESNSGYGAYIWPADEPFDAVDPVERIGGERPKGKWRAR